MSGLDPGVIGEGAAVATSFLWTISSIFFTSAGKRIGWLSVNAFRTLIAIALLAVTQVILLGTVVPLASLGQWFWMGLSGIVGLGVGDSGLFAAYLAIGPRRSLLLMALAPIFAAVGAYLMLGETIPELAIAGIGITLIGVVVVILESEERSGEPSISSRRRVSGVCFGLIAAFGQGVGLVLAKKGIDLIPGTTLNPVSATLMRLLLGASFIWVLALVVGKIPEVVRATRNRYGMRDTAAASLVGPYLGITLSMVAVTLTETGVAQTLLSLMPVMIIPVIWILYGQRTSWRGMMGA
ncbi:MAG TPA: DMT family transporter, partial [Candidatus Acidoferrales bacterium]|nr:DMT family transporter [Candidatus Acidoferrales bacterium]